MLNAVRGVLHSMHPHVFRNMGALASFRRLYSQNLTEKITQGAAVGLAPGTVLKSGDYVEVMPSHFLTHDNTSAVMGKFKEFGAQKMADPQQPMFALDHDIQNPKNLAEGGKYANIKAFARQMEVDFYPASFGIGHQLMIAMGYVLPGGFYGASDSHSNIYGALGALGTPFVRTDAAAIWATGKTWWQIPAVAQVILTGSLLPGVTGKDLILSLCGIYNQDQLLNHAIEFTGDGVQSLSIDERLTIANLSTEWGALTGVFPQDEKTIQFLRDRANTIERLDLKGLDPILAQRLKARLNHQKIDEIEAKPLRSDPDAYYAKVIELELSSVRPFVTGPHNLKTGMPISGLRDPIKIDKAYLLGCANSRVEDLAEAAKVVAGKKVAPGVEFYIAAASREVQEESIRRGDWQKLLDAGAIALLPSCGPCIGLGIGLAKAGEAVISATNRNFKGRMGDKTSEAYLGSPATVAASAIAGTIVSPFEHKSIRAITSITENPKPVAVQSVRILEGFPKSIQGDLVFCNQSDNLNTDGIWAGKRTYEDIPFEKQAAFVMENYDSEFRNKVKEGDILVGGFNFGTGSSREQAATALKSKGIPCIIGGSFSDTYKRNAINNGVLIFEAPGLVKALKSEFGTKELTTATNMKATVDFENSKVIVGDVEFDMSPVGEVAQQLIIDAGLENQIKKQMAKEGK